LLERRICHKKINYQTIKLSELEEYRLELIDDMPNKKQISQKLKEIKNKYNDNSFSVNEKS